MTNKEIHDYLRSKRFVKKFAQFLGMTEQGTIYRLSKGKKNVYEDVNRFFKSSRDYQEELAYIDSLKTKVELATKRTNNKVDENFFKNMEKEFNILKDFCLGGENEK